MSIKNRPTLKTQFLNFISRLAPFDGNPLIQKTEHNQVIQDHLDSQVLKIDESVAVVTAATMNLDASTADLFTIDTGAAGTAARTININNLETGQRVRVEITKKTGDTFTVGSSEWWPIRDGSGNIEQTGLTDLSFEAWNINGAIRVSRLKASKISDSLALNESYSIASSKAAKTLNDAILLKANKAQGGWTNITLINSWAVSSGRTPQYRTDEFGVTHLRGMLNAGSATSATVTGAAEVPAPDAGSASARTWAVYTNVAGLDATNMSVTDLGALIAGTFGSSGIVSLDGISYTTDSF